MGLLRVSTSPVRNTHRGDTRRLVAAVFGIWALVLQSLLPTAGALASQTGNGLLMGLCTVAGLQSILVSSDPAEDVDRPAPPKNSAGCDFCVTGGCMKGVFFCGATAVLSATEWILVAWNMSAYGAVVRETPAGFHARGPPGDITDFIRNSLCFEATSSVL